MKNEKVNLKLKAEKPKTKTQNLKVHRRMAIHKFWALIFKL